MGVKTFAFGFIFIVLSAISDNSYASSFSSNTCQILDFEELFLLPDRECIFDADGGPLFTDVLPRVAEVNGTILESILNILQSRRNVHVAILFYASWCPFSAKLRPLFDTLAAEYPAIHHLAVEDSAIQPSALSQHGVHSFPVLFLYSKTVKMRYHGPRTFEAISEFYKDVTGLKHSGLGKRGSEGMAFLKKISKLVTVRDRANCPYPWVKSPEKWLHEDMYLLLSSMFVLLRVIICFIPRLFSSLKNYWLEKENPHRILLRRVLGRAPSSIIRSPIRSSFESDKLRKGKAVLSVSGWPSTHLAAVTLKETGSSRNAGTEDGRDT
ncbi:hypothetical protein KP509_16G006600 [Ceratopteris richardii]|uniref:Thioredoxin domain-containing protein n=1 Tax=Ceratopteris richardii TaxID=49495 RepID=A0A8T2T0K0_CERRI|nr:hypothetical protein KP509_16G006600 [Ceratopteris richardii]